MWIRSIDDALINLSAVEAIRLMDLYPEDADPDAVEAGRVEPDAFEIVAYLASGYEAILYVGEDAQEAERAQDYIAGLLATDGVSATIGGGRVRGLVELMRRASSGSSN